MSIHINLLPYREAAKKANQKQLAVLAGLCAGLALALSLLVHAVLAGVQGVQEERNRFIKSENARLDKEIAEIQRLKDDIQALLARKQIIENLQADRGAATQLFDEMVRRTPAGLYLKSMKQSGQKITVTGYALSSDLVSSFMRSIQQSEHLRSPELVEIKAATVGGRSMSEFNLFFEMKTHQAVEGRDDKAAGDALAKGKPQPGRSGKTEPARVPAAKPSKE